MTKYFKNKIHFTWNLASENRVAAHKARYASIVTVLEKNWIFTEIHFHYIKSTEPEYTVNKLQVLLYLLCRRMWFHSSSQNFLHKRVQSLLLLSKANAFSLFWIAYFLCRCAVILILLFSTLHGEVTDLMCVKNQQRAVVSMLNEVFDRLWELLLQRHNVSVWFIRLKKKTLTKIIILKKKVNFM